MKVVTAGILSAPMALVRKNTKISQNTTRPMPLLGRAPGRTRSTYLLASDSCRCWSSPSWSSTLRTTEATILATMKPISKITWQPKMLGRNPTRLSKAFWKLSLTSTALLLLKAGRLTTPVGMPVPGRLQRKHPCAYKVNKFLGEDRRACRTGPVEDRDRDRRAHRDRGRSERA